MKQITYKNTNVPGERVNFETALLEGLGKDYGLYMMDKKDLPQFSSEQLASMSRMSYAQIAFQVLRPFLESEIPSEKLEALLNDAYDESKIPTKVEHVGEYTHIMWLTGGPTYSFKDYAARFYGRALNHFLKEKGLKRTVIVATSGDTGGAVADALWGLDRVNNIVFYPRGSISEGQRRQMTTLGRNVYAFEVNGDFDVCQALAKTLLKEEQFAEEVFRDRKHFTSANSISLGRLLPQAVYPFYAYSRMDADGRPIIASVPSGNFGDMMGTVLAKAMGLPIAKILCGVNENDEFPIFLRTGKYEVKPTIASPSSAMNVSHPSNLARLVDFYGGHMFDERDSKTKKVTKEGVIDKMPDLEAMRRDIWSVSIRNEEHYKTMKEVHEKFRVVLDPHGAVGWRALELYREGKLIVPSVIYETADPGKFPNDVERAIGIRPLLPEGMKKQAKAEERVYSIKSESQKTESGLKLTQEQIDEAKSKIKEIFSN
jgi:threonine synthase